MAAGVGDVDPDEVAKIASDPRWIFKETDFAGLASRTNDIIKEACRACENWIFTIIHFHAHIIQSHLHRHRHRHSH